MDTVPGAGCEETLDTLLNTGVGVAVAVPFKKDTVMVLGLDRLTTQELLRDDEHPFHELMYEPVKGSAEMVICELDGKEYEQTVPQLMPLGTEVIVPSPAPVLVTVRV